MQQTAMQVQEQNASGTKEKGVFTDLLRVSFLSRITATHINELLEANGVPKPVWLKLNTAFHALGELVQTTKAEMPVHDANWLKKTPKGSVLYDMSLVMDLLAKVHLEDGQEQYSEFLTLLVGCINTVIYAQEKGKKLHFGKYKALFELFISEMKADINRQPGQILFQNKTIYTRTSVPVGEEQIK